MERSAVDPSQALGATNRSAAAASFAPDAVNALRQLAFERSVLERLVRGEPLETVLEAMVIGHEALFPGTIGSILILDEEGRRLRRGSAPNLPEEYSAAIDGLEIGPLAGSCGTAAFTRRTVVVEDIATDERWRPGRELARSHGLAACWSTPILSGRGRVLGTFALYYKERRAPLAHELKAIENSARLAALAIERGRSQRDLDSFTERLALAKRSAQMGIFDLDVASGHLDWDEQMLAIYGVRREDFREHYECWRERVHPEDLEAAEVKVLDAIEGERPFETTFRIIRPDGDVRFIEARTLIQRDPTGRARRIIGVNMDVTEKKRLESQLLRSQRLESVGRLAGGIAHDLNNLLAPILVGPSMLRECVQDPEARELLDTMEASARRAAGVIRQLLTFSRGSEAPHVPLDACDVVDEMLRIVHGTFPKNIIAVRGGAERVWNVLGDATQLHQVLMNLCVNARDAMPEGGTLELRLENAVVDAATARMHPPAQPGKYVRLSVIDSGSGIDPRHMDRLFEPFFTTKEIGRGTGLGLPTVMGIVQSHGGFIQVESRRGRGTSFRVHLPATSGAVVASGTAEASGEAHPRPGSNETILVVDDEDAIRRITQGMLERHGYRALLARGGAEALEVLAARRGEIALVLTDMMMPGIDGAALVRELRRIAPETPIVAMSGNFGTGREDEAMRGLVQAALEKPFTIEQLLDGVASALRRGALPPAGA